MFVFVCYGVHVAFVLVTLTILLIIHLTYSNPYHTPLINTKLILRFLFDYLVATLIHVILTLIYAHFVQKKRYFRYQLESMRGIRSMTDFMVYSGLLIYLTPFFFMLWQ